MLDIDYLFNFKDEDFDRARAGAADIRRFPTSVASVPVEGWMEMLTASSGCTLVRRTYRFPPKVHGQRIVLGEFGWTPPERVFMFHTVRGGIVGQCQDDAAGELIYRPEQGCFRRIDRRVEVTLWLEKAVNANMAALILSEARLIEWLGPSLAERLIQRLDIDASRVRVWPVPLAVTAPLHAALFNQTNGCLLRLFAQARILDYLVALNAHLGLTENRAHPRQRARDAARDLNAYLGELEGKLPSLDALGAQFGLSARRLNTAFVNEYGLPIHRFIAEQRLREAHQAILDSDISLKQLAARLGYTHVNHFNAAFKRLFGYPPGSLRRGRRIDDDETEQDAV